jgi:hypothetical protein
MDTTRVFVPYAREKQELQDIEDGLITVTSGRRANLESIVASITPLETLVLTYADHLTQQAKPRELVAELRQAILTWKANGMSDEYLIHILNKVRRKANVIPSFSSSTQYAHGVSNKSAAGAYEIELKRLKRNV